MARACWSSLRDGRDADKPIKKEKETSVVCVVLHLSASRAAPSVQALSKTGLKETDQRKNVELNLLNQQQLFWTQPS